MYIEHVLNKHPIIGAIKDIEDLEGVAAEGMDVLFILRSKLSSLNKMVIQAKELDTLVFLHLDMVKGIGNDREAIKYLAEEIGIDGVVTTKSYLIKAAKKEDLITIQRLFLLDSESLRTGVNIINNTKPDLIEVLPGLVVPEMIDRLEDKIDLPMIAGGLIRDPLVVRKVLNSKVLAISTSDQELWKMNFSKGSLSQPNEA